MIVSASRRTDIPAFYGAWMMRRLDAGYALVRSPYSAHRVSRVPLTPDVVDCIVFWTKNPIPMETAFPQIAAMGFPFYVQFTLTPYGPELEQCLPPKQTLVEAFCGCPICLARRVLSGGTTLSSWIRRIPFRGISRRLGACAGVWQALQSGACSALPTPINGAAAPLGPCPNTISSRSHAVLPSLPGRRALRCIPAPSRAISAHTVFCRVHASTARLLSGR